MTNKNVYTLKNIHQNYNGNNLKCANGNWNDNFDFFSIVHSLVYVTWNICTFNL